MITIQYVKDYFPLWDQYFVDANGDPDDTVLQNEINLSDQEMLEYIPDLTSSNITDSLKLHLLNIVIKRGFNLKHGDTEFENNPQILKDYDNTIAKLEEYHKGLLKTPDTTVEDETKFIKINAKTRRFGEWFL